MHYSKKDYDTNYLYLKKITKELKISFIDLHTEAFGKEQNPDKFDPFEGGHYTVEGYKLAAETIYKFTKD